MSLSTERRVGSEVWTRAKVPVPRVGSASSWVTVPHGALEVVVLMVVVAVVGRTSLTNISSVADGAESRLECAVVAAGRSSSSTDISSVAGTAELRSECEVFDMASEISPGS